MRLKDKLLLINVSTVLLVLLVGGSILYFIVRQQTEKNIRSELNNTVELIFNSVQNSIQISIRNHLRTLATEYKGFFHHFYNRYQAGDLTPEQAYAQIRQLILSKPNATIGKSGYVFTTDGKGRVRIHPLLARGTDLSPYPFTQEAIRKKEGYLEYKWQNKGELRIREKAAAYAYFEPWDEIIWISSYKENFSHLVSIEDFQELLGRVKIGESGDVSIIDGSGNALIHPFFQGKNLKNLQDEEGRPVIQDILRLQNGNIFYSFRNPDKSEFHQIIAYFKHLPALDWIIIATAYDKEIYAPVRQLSIIITLTIFGTLVVLGLVILWISERITRPISNLAESMQKVVEGDRNIQLNIHSNDEIGELSRKFNSMSAYLQGSFEEMESQKKEIEKYNAELEKILGEKTKNLNHALDEIRKKNEQTLLELQLQQKNNSGKNNSPAIRSYLFSSLDSEKPVLTGQQFTWILLPDGKFGFLALANPSQRPVSNLLLALSRTAFQTYASYEYPVQEIARKMNQDILNFVGNAEFYINAYLGILDARQGTLEINNSGMPPALLFRAASRETIPLSSEGFMLGITKDIFYGATKVRLTPGDILLITNNLAKIQNSQKQEFGHKRIQEFLEIHHPMEPKHFADALLLHLNQFSGSTWTQTPQIIQYMQFLHRQSNAFSLHECLYCESREISSYAKNLHDEAVQKDIANLTKNVRHLLLEEKFKDVLQLFDRLPSELSEDYQIQETMIETYFRIGDHKRAKELFESSLIIEESYT